MAITKEKAKQLIREGVQGYTIMGGYPMAAVMHDGELMCHECVQANAKRMYHELLYPCDPQWQIRKVIILWEGPAQHCSNCCNPMHTAYGDPERHPDSESLEDKGLFLGGYGT